MTARRSVEAALPPDVLRESSQRLGLVALAMAGLLFVNNVLDVVIPWMGYSDGSVAEGIFTGLGIVLSLLVWALSRRRDISVERLLDIGLAYEVLVCFCIAAMENLTQPAPGQEARGVSWICLVIVLFPIYMPAPPMRVMVASFLAALTGPLTVPLVTHVTHYAAPPLFLAAGLFAPNFISVGLALVSVVVIHRLSEKVREARELGAYQLEKMLGSGGMGEVWLARHRQLLTPAAIKLIRLDALQGNPLGPPETVQRRFRREAKATASLRSPHTVTLYDFGQADDHSLYYVMEMLDGIDLQQLVERFGPLPAPRVAHILRQACDSLQEAHNQQLVHRDIKPANLFVCRMGVTIDFVKVLDFGLVKSTAPVADLTDLSDDQGRLTRPNTVFGTPECMSPEQVTATEIDGRADIYSLGCVAYWLLTGRTVFQAPTPMAMLMAHVNTPPPPPSVHVAVPAALEKIVMRCLEKAPERRPASAKALDDLLEQCTPEVGLWTQEQARAWWERNLPATGVEA